MEDLEEFAIIVALSYILQPFRYIIGCVLVVMAWHVVDYIDNQHTVTNQSGYQFTTTNMEISPDVDMVQVNSSYILRNQTGHNINKAVLHVSLYSCPSERAADGDVSDCEGVQRNIVNVPMDTASGLQKTGSFSTIFNNVSPNDAYYVAKTDVSFVQEDMGT